MTGARRWIGAAVAAGLSLAGAEGAAQSAGDAGPEILHMPLLERSAEQGILQPVPIAVELPEEVAVRARRVLVHYRLWGDPDWTSLEMRRGEEAHEGAIPCLEISTVTGDLRYYIRVHDADGRVIAAAASRAMPYVVTIKHDGALAPGAPRVAKCPDPADCPRGLQGCPSERVIEIACQDDRDCEGGLTCGLRGVCELDARRKRWLSLSIEQDVGVIPRAGVCNYHAQEHDGYACYRADGEPYVGDPVTTNEPLGVGRGPTRVVLGYDHLIQADTSLGVRIGWAVAGEGPTPREGTDFVPFSIAARATHWFGADPFAGRSLRPFAFVGAGYAMVDVETTAEVREDPTQIGFQGGNDLEQTVDLWKRAGDGFAGLGGGLALPVSDGVAAFAEVSVMGVFPFGAVVVAPTAGMMVGF